MIEDIDTKRRHAGPVTCVGVRPGDAVSDKERKRKRVTVHISQCIHPRAQNLKGLGRDVSSTTWKALSACSEAVGRRGEALVAVGARGGRVAVAWVSRGGWRGSRVAGRGCARWPRGPIAGADTEPQIKCSCDAPTRAGAPPANTSSTTINKKRIQRKTKESYVITFKNETKKPIADVNEIKKEHQQLTSKINIQVIRR